MIPGIILVITALIGVLAGGSLTSVLGIQALSLLVWTGMLGTAIRKKWPSGAVFETVTSHKWCGAATVALSLLHVIAAIVDEPERYRYFIPLGAPPPGAAGIASLVMLLVVFGLGQYKKHVSMMPGYRWKTFHGLTAVLAALFGLTHVIWLGNLIYDPIWQIFFLLLVAGSVALIAVRLRT